MGRVKYQSGSKIKVPTPAALKKMTMGGLKEIFCTLISQNQNGIQNLVSAFTEAKSRSDWRIHKMKSKSTEAALRRRVGPHFWLINNALSLLV